MHCYNHHKQDAIGICQKCGKGLCQDCCEPGENYLACSAACAQIIKENDELNKRAKALYCIGRNATAKRIPLACLSFLALGAVFVGFSFYNYLQYFYWGSVDSFFFLIGCVMLTISFLYWRRAKKTGLNL